MVTTLAQSRETSFRADLEDKMVYALTATYSGRDVMQWVCGVDQNMWTRTTAITERIPAMISPFLRRGLAALFLALLTNQPLRAELTLTDDQIAFLPAHKLAGYLQDGQLSATRLVQIYLDRIDRYNPQINAIVTLDREGALARAAEADAARTRGEIWGPLHGVPVTLKDNFAVKGMRSTAGYPPLADNIPDSDSAVAARLRDAGAIILGKTNMPQLGLDAQTYNPIFGVTNNPWDLSRSPGGSSGGDAAAVAAGLTALSVGNDIGGSLRFPAHFTGIYALKTTEGMIPDTGMVREADTPRTLRHLAVHGPLARDAGDLALALSVLAGPDGRDYQVPLAVTAPPPPPALADLNIAWSNALADDIFVAPETRAMLQGFIDRLHAAGAQVTQARPKGFDLDQTMAAYSDLFATEVLIDLPWLDRQLMCLEDRLGCPATDTRDYFAQLNARDRIAAQIEGFLTEHDVWILPVTSGPAHTHMIAEEFDGPLPIYTAPPMIGDQSHRRSVFTVPFSLSGHPVVIVPMGLTQDGLPIGLQLVGRRWHDAELIALAQALTPASALLHPDLP